MIDLETFKELAAREDWPALHALFDEAHDQAVTLDDKRSEVHWRGVALEQQQRYGEALDQLRENADVFDSKCRLRLGLACLLVKLGREGEALDALSKAPFEAEMTSFYGLALDAKFFYFYLLAKQGDPSVRERLSEIPDDYTHVTMDIQFLTKEDIVASCPTASRSDG